MEQGLMCTTEMTDFSPPAPSDEVIFANEWKHLFSIGQDAYFTKHS